MNNDAAWMRRDYAGGLEGANRMFAPGSRIPFLTLFIKLLIAIKFWDSNPRIGGSLYMLVLGWRELQFSRGVQKAVSDTPRHQSH
jgi:hypothetical protein